MTTGFRPAVPMRTLSFPVETRMYDAIARRAAAMGRTVPQYARLIFDAAYAARVFREKGQTPEDAEMDRQVVTVFALADCEPEYIAEATGIPLSTCRRILEGFSIVARERAQDKPRPLAAGAAVRPDVESDAEAPAAKSGELQAERERAISLWTDADRERVCALWAEGKSVREIAAAVGRAEGATSVWLSKHRDICPRRR